MSELYEKYIEVLETSDLPNEVAEASADALAFCNSLNNVLRENGAKIPEEPNLSDMENALDGILMELAVATLFLSNSNIPIDVPKTLRGISDKVKDTEGPSRLLSKAYCWLADRVEKTAEGWEKINEVRTDNEGTTPEGRGE